MATRKPIPTALEFKAAVSPTSQATKPTATPKAATRLPTAPTGPGFFGATIPGKKTTPTAPAVPGNLNPEFLKKHPTFAKIVVPITRAVQAVDQTAPGRVLNRLSQRAGEAATGGEFNYEAPDAGRLNKAIDLAGFMLSFATPGGVTSTAAKAGSLASKAVKLPGKVAPTVLRGGTLGAGIGLGEAAGKGEGFVDTTKTVGKEAALWAALDVAGLGVGVAGKALWNKMPTSTKLATQKRFTKQQVAEVVEGMAVKEPVAPRAVKEGPKLLPAPQGFTFRDLTHAEKVGRVLPKEPALLPAPKVNFELPKGYTTRMATTGTLKRSTSGVAQAEKALTEGIETIQNHMQHYDVLAKYPGMPIRDAVAKAEQATGVSMEKLLADYQTAYTKANAPISDLPKIGADKVRLANVAGVKELPKLSKLERPLQLKTQIPRPFEKPGPVPARPPFEERPLQFKTTISKPKIYDKSAINEVAATVEVKPVPLVKAPGAGQPPKPPEAVGFAVNELRDLSGMRLYGTDVYRNFRDAFGKQFGKVKQTVLDPFDAGKKEFAGMQREWTTRLKNDVVDGLGIDKGKRLSGLVQQYGEKKITLDELKKAAPNDWGKVVKADEWFRKAYDQVLDEVNAVRAKIYPNVEKQLAKIEVKIENVKADKTLTKTERASQLESLAAQSEEAFRGKRIPKRSDYYRHFKELSDSYAGVKNLFESPAAINPSLAGVSDYTQPKSKYLSFAQKRLGGKFKNDAVGGFLEYIPAASYAKHIDPHIGVFRTLANDLADATASTRNLNNFIEYLRTFADDLSGKTNFIDRSIQKVVGRKAFQALDILNRRIKANVILGNIGSAMSQIANVPQGVAYAKQYSIPGVRKTIRSLFMEQKGPIAQSGFMSERTLGKAYRQFDTKLLQQPKNAAVWLIETMDRVGTEFIWNSAYAKAVAEGAATPIKQADDIARSLVAGRGVGEVPLVQKSKAVQLLLPFTLEVANLWKVQKDFLKAKDIGALMILYGSNWLFNEVMERTRGTRVVFDPIDALRDAFSEEDISPVQRGGRLLGEALSNTPGGQFLASAYPEYGTTVGGLKLPTREGFFGDNDPTRFGSGVLSIKGIQKPATYMALPFGGLQAQKLIGGLDALRRKGAYTEKPSAIGLAKEIVTGEIPERKELKYPVETSKPNIARGLLFGTGGFPETRDYYENDRRPLSEKQTGLLERRVASGYDKKALYDMQINEREVNKIDAKISDTTKNKELTLEQRRAERARLTEQKKELLNARSVIRARLKR